ncbi:MAG TPA: calcineurin-like phosphoesterase family protein [Sphingobacterium sp.]|nr:calcineurin-like phosphoesterase family protein [Sphingobacterium sp.]
MKSKKFGIKGIWLFCLLTICIFIFSQCSKTTSTDNDGSPVVLSITNISLPSVVDVTENGDMFLTARGFDIGDEVIVTSTEDSNVEYVLPLKAVTTQSGTITLPSGFSAGNYRLAVRRGERTVVLGAVQIRIVVHIPDRAGMNVKGQVAANGVGIPNAVVSDGFEVTVTDAKGIYYLKSEKKNGYVFISIPGNYEVARDGNIPQFFKRFASTQVPIVERMDFVLQPVNNEKHIVLAMADLHLAARTRDLAQFESGFLPDANQTIESYTNQGYKVYGLTLGDLAWESYWYSNKFALPEYVVQMNRINCPVFNTIGNHDHDPYYADDWYAENAYRHNLGPNYYSFNLGDIHYVVLDNTEYINTGGSVGVMGDRSYNALISEEQLAWLKKDLATIQDKSKPLVVAMHIPLLNAPGIDANGNETQGSVRVSGGTRLINEILVPFSDVHVFSGHSHINWAKQYGDNLIEHNIGAVSATWWWTGYHTDNHICKNGAPGGYAIINRTNNDFSWYYKGIGFEKDYQFRTYDLNEIHITAANFAPNATDAVLAPYVWDYAVPNKKNEILVNVWGYDPEWNIEILEGGTSLPVTRVTGRDPLHIISYNIERIKAGSTPTSSFVTSAPRHLFKATASSANSTVQINVTDRFGNVYRETMTRPKTFSYSIK